MTQPQPKRCLTCGYILDHLPEPRCPECGRAFDPSNPDTFETGPRWRPMRAPLAVCLALVSPCVIGPFGPGSPFFLIVLAVLAALILWLGITALVRRPQERYPRQRLDTVVDWILAPLAILFAGIILTFLVHEVWR